MSAHSLAIQAAERRRLAIPDNVQQAAAVIAAIEAAQRQPDPERPALPTNPDDVLRAITEHALQVNQAELERLAAGRFIDDARQALTTAVAGAVPAWISGMDKEFQTLIKAVTKAADKLPANVRTDRINWTDTAVTAPYERAEAAAVQLDQLVADRNTIARAGGHDGGQDNALYAIAHLPEPTVDQVMAARWRELSPILAEWRDLRSQPVARWVHLVRSPDVTLSLAAPGEVRRRAIHVQAWRDAEITRLHGGAVSTALSRVQRSLAA